MFKAEVRVWSVGLRVLAIRVRAGTVCPGMVMGSGDVGFALQIAVEVPEGEVEQQFRNTCLLLSCRHLNHAFIDDCARHLQPSYGRACLFTHHTTLPQLYPCDVDAQRKTAKDSPRHIQKLQLADAQQITSSSTAKSRVPALQPVNVPEGKVEPSGFKTPASFDLHVRMCQIMVAFFGSLQ